MRRKFGNKIYDLDTAHIVAWEYIDWEQGGIPDFESLRLTPEGNYFVFGGGGMSSEYIEPVSLEDAKIWIKTRTAPAHLSEEEAEQVIASFERSAFEKKD